MDPVTHWDTGRFIGSQVFSSGMLEIHIKQDAWATPTSKMLGLHQQAGCLMAS